MTCDVAIVGAGPTGLTLANLLGAAGVRAILIERNASTVQEPRAVSIDDESLRTLAAIGVADDVIRDVILECGYHYVGPSGSCFLRVEPTARPFGFPRRSSFQQPRLEATLRLGLERFPSVTPLFEHTFEGATEDADGVTVGLRAAAGAATSIRARYVVGCDGARSTLRQAVGATLVGSTYQQRWLIVDLADTRERGRHSRVFCDPARPAITLPGPHSTRRYEFMLHDHELDDEATSPPFVQHLLASHGPDADAPVARRQVYTFHARLADRWRRGRMFLAGDAAHLSPPFAGQGMNSGIRDAHNLGWKLAAVVDGSLGPGVLDSYEAERAPHAAALIQMAITIGRVMMPASRFQASAVRAGFRLAGLVPRVQTYFAEMRYKPKPHYEAGFRVSTHDDGLTGRMFPQPLLTRDGLDQPLDAVVGSGFSLVAWGPDALALIASTTDLDFGVTPLARVGVLPAGSPGVAAGPPRTREQAPAAYVDQTNGLKGVTRRGVTSLALLRPDRYVAGAVAVSSGASSAAALATATRALFARTWNDAGDSR